MHATRLQLQLQFQLAALQFHCIYEIITFHD